MATFFQLLYYLGKWQIYCGLISGVIVQYELAEGTYIYSLYTLEA